MSKISDKVATENCIAILKQLTFEGKVIRKAFYAEMQSRSMKQYGKPLTQSQIALLDRIATVYETEMQS